MCQDITETPVLSSVIVEGPVGTGRGECSPSWYFLLGLVIVYDGVSVSRYLISGVAHRLLYYRNDMSERVHHHQSISTRLTPSFRHRSPQRPPAFRHPEKR